MENQSLFPALSRNDSLSFVTKALIASLFIAISAQVAVPFWPVPMTMQPFAILVVALLNTPSLAAASVVAYLVEGSIGFPVFSNFSSGIHHLVGTTGGYLVGFVAMAWVVSQLKGWAQESAVRLFIICLVGQAVLHTFGLTWLTTFVGFKSALSLGLLPFILKIPFTNILAIVTSQMALSAKQRWL